MTKKTLISWSTGKDSAWTLQLLRRDPHIDVVGLFCTVNKVFRRVAVHGVGLELLNLQAKSIGLPLYIVDLPYPCDNDEYVSAMASFIVNAKENGVECLAFGDLFLQNVRGYRETLLAGTGLTPIFPLWGMPTEALSKQMISSGLNAVITCVDSQYLTKDFSGREYNESFLKDLPKELDPCGENGEFHSFVFDGPMFQEKLEITVGETIQRDRIYFTDLLPAGALPKSSISVSQRLCASAF